MGFRIGVAAALATAVAMLGCEGGNDAGWETVIGANAAPAIRHLHIEHDDPEAPGRVRAVVELRDPDQDGVEIDYAWEVAGVARPETGPELSLPRARKGTRVSVTAVAKRARARSEPALRVIHLQNTRPKPVRRSWRSARPRDASRAEVADADRSDGLTRVGRSSFESRASVVELEADGEGEALRYAVELPHAEGASGIRFRLLQGPEGMWVHPASGEVTWLPEPWQTGTHSVEVEITDASGAVTVEAFSVNAGADEAPSSLPAKLAVP